MHEIHPALPHDRPLAVSHRAGNEIDLARKAIEIGVDMLETDIWTHLGHLEVRHLKTLGPIPILWDRWYVHGFGGKRLKLHELLDDLPPDLRLFLDLKGYHPRLGQRIVEAIHSRHPERQIILCGRNWRQLDPVAGKPNVFVFYSIGDEKQLSQVWQKLAGMTYPAVSIRHSLLTEAVTQRLKAMGTTIIAWTVNDPALAKTLYLRGVDGFTSDNEELLVDIVTHRGAAFADEAPVTLPPEAANAVPE